MKSDSRMIQKLFFSLIPVQILLVAIGSLNSVIDGVMASRFIGPDAMTVTGLYMPLIKIIETINAVLLGGSQILCGQFLGKNQVERTRSVFSLDMLVIAGMSCLVSALCLLFPMGMARMLGADAASAEGLKSYILGTAGGILPQMLCAQLSAFLQLEQQNRRAYLGILVMMAVNAGLDYLFIVVLRRGLFGLGLATALSYWAFFLVLGAYYFQKKAVIRFRFRGIQGRDLGPILRIGIPGAVVVFCLSLRGFAVNALLLRHSGGDGVAALAALNTFGGLLYATTAGIASTTRLLVSVYVGEEDRVGIVQIMKTALLRGVPIVAGVAALVCLLAAPLTKVFFPDTGSNVFLLTRALFRIYPLCMPLSAICAIFINYYQSCSRTGIVHVLSVMDGVLGVCLSSLLLAPLMGAVGVWIAHVLNGVYTTLAVVLYAGIRNRRFPRTFEELLTMEEGFGVSEDRRLALTVRSFNEVSEASQEIVDFCRRMGFDKTRAFHAGLCMEELASNVIEHGFGDGRRHSVELRVVQKADTTLLRVKDDYRAFNPKEAMEMLDPADITHHIGLRIVSRYAKKMYYNSALGLNVLSIEI